MTTINKTFVRQQFNSGLNTYSEQASVQKSIAQKLATELIKQDPLASDKLFEIGCGTGFLTKEILNKVMPKQLITNDISETSRHKIATLSEQYKLEIPFLQGDAEEIEFPLNIDALISGSTIQWFKHKQLFFDKAAASLKSGGFLAISTFGRQNFKEIKALTKVGLDYHNLQELSEMLAGKYSISTAHEWTETLSFDKPVDVLRHIKQTGVNGIKPCFWTKAKLKDFSTKYYECFSDAANKVSLTYNPILIIARKK